MSGTGAGSEQRAKAERLRALHHSPPVLVLPNAWDVASALVFARHPGCRALATTSAGVAAVLGYPDGELIPRADMLELVERITRAVDLPVTADLEAGYGATPDDAAETAAGAIDAGAVGLNLEDGVVGEQALVPVYAHVGKIEAVRQVGEELDVPLVVNARVDTYINSVGKPEERFEETVRRANAYRRAGADSLFVPAVVDAETIAALAKALDGPLNVLAGAGTPTVGELERLGVARLSIGSGAHRATMALTERIADELLREGSFTFLDGALPYQDTQELLGARAGSGLMRPLLVLAVAVVCAHRDEPRLRSQGVRARRLGHARRETPARETRNSHGCRREPAVLRRGGSSSRRSAPPARFPSAS